MNEPKFTELSFEKIDRSGHGMGNAGYLMTILTLISGVIVLWTGNATRTVVIGVSFIVVACLGYIKLLRSAPKLRYFRYFWLDQLGLHHIEGDSPSGRTAHFAWQEIRSAIVSAPSDDFKGLIITVERPGMRGVPFIYRWMRPKRQLAL